MALTKILKNIKALKDKVLLTSGKFIRSKSDDINNSALYNNGFYPEVGVPVINRLFPKRRRRLEGFMPKAIIMAMSLVIFSCIFANKASATITFNGFSVGAQTGTATYGSLSTPKFTFTITKVLNSGAGSATITGVTGLPAGVSFSPTTSMALSTGSNNIATQLTLTTSGTSPAGIYTFTVTLKDITTGSSYSNTGTLTISPKALTITATGPQKVQGIAQGSGSYTTNFAVGATANGETVTSVTLTLSNTGAQTAGQTYTVTPSAAVGITASNYTISYVNFNGTVVATATLTITVPSLSQVYGSVDLSQITATYSGWIGTDDINSLSVLPDIAYTPTDNYVGVGSYSLTPSGAGAPAYYNIVYVPGTLTVTKAPMTITATGPTRVPTDNLAATFISTTNFSTYGTVNGESVTSLTFTPSPAGTQASGGSYTITPSLATSNSTGFGAGFNPANYTITYAKYTGTCGGTFTWSGATSTAWTTATNWVGGVAPATTDNVIIPGSTVRAPVVGTGSINTITFTGNNTLTISAGLTFTVTSGFTVNAGVTANIIGSTTSSTLTFSTAVLSNSGTFHMSGGSLIMSAGASYIYNYSTGTFTLDGGNTCEITGNGNAFNNAIVNAGVFYLGTSNSACRFVFDDSQSITNQGNFYVGSTSVIYYFNSSAHNCYVTNTGNFTFQSDQYGSAALLNVPQTTDTWTGTYRVERYMSGQRGYRLMASPVYSTTDSYNNKIYSLNYVGSSAWLTGTTGIAGGFDVPAHSGPTLYLYREDVPVSNATFISGNYQGINDITNPPSYVLDNPSGFSPGSYTIPTSNGFLFFFRGNKASGSAAQETVTTWPATAVTMTAVGSLNTGTVTFRDWYNPSSTALGYSNSDVTAQGFNLVGNPYPCSIDWESLGSGITSTNLSTTVYELNPATKNYSTYTKGGPALNNASRYIVSGQGFFVLATGTGATLTLTENAKAGAGANPGTNYGNTGVNLFMGKPDDQLTNNQYIKMKMALDTINTDEMIVLFSNNNKAVFDSNEDAPYKQGSGKVSLSSLSSDRMQLAVNRMPLNQKNQTIALKVNANADGIYSLGMNEVKGIPKLYDIWLMDAYKKDSLDLRANSSYKFNIFRADTGSYGANRFKLVMRQNPAYAYHLLNFKATKATARQVQLVWVTENEANYTHFTVERSTDGGITYEVIGGQISADAGTYSLLDKSPGNNNLYRLKQEDFNNTISYSSIIPIEYANLSDNLAKNNINLYPNPTKDMVNLSIASTTTAESFNIKITNSAGLILQQTTSKQPQWQSNVSSFLPGTYYIQVTNSKDQSIIGKSKFVKL